MLVTFPEHKWVILRVGQAKRLVTGAAQQVLDLFQQYSWPGNIRELRNVLKRGVFTGKTEWIRQEDLPFDFAQRLATPLSKLADHDEQLRELSHQLFVAALKQCHGNRSRAAVLLGLTRKSSTGDSNCTGWTANRPITGRENRIGSNE